MPAAPAPTDPYGLMAEFDGPDDLVEATGAPMSTATA